MIIWYEKTYWEIILQDLGSCTHMQKGLQNRIDVILIWHDIDTWLCQCHAHTSCIHELIKEMTRNQKYLQCNVILYVWLFTTMSLWRLANGFKSFLKDMKDFQDFYHIEGLGNRSAVKVDFTFQKIAWFHPFCFKITRYLSKQWWVKFKITEFPGIFNQIFLVKWSELLFPRKSSKLYFLRETILTRCVLT